MVELARHHGSGPVSLSEMAEHEALPRPYLEQLVVSLREAGLVISTRGAHGGYELSREPSQIHMGDVVAALEGPIAPMVCVSGDAHPGELCARGGYCRVDRLWRRVRDAVVQALESTTLAELALPAPGHPVHWDLAAQSGRPNLHDAVLVTVRPLNERPSKEPIAQP
jgi:Rrf2 family protein